MGYIEWSVIIHAVLAALAVYLFMKVTKIIGTILLILIAISVLVNLYYWIVLPAQ